MEESVLLCGLAKDIAETHSRNEVNRMREESLETVKTKRVKALINTFWTTVEKLVIEKATVQSSNSETVASNE
ncbi:MAG: hypothetical protein ACK5MV_03910 [Aminipila sp.]